MIEVKRILCPTDLSTESDEALRYAVALASAYSASLLLLHCSKERVHADENSTKFLSQMNRIFTASLAPHLGLANPQTLHWEGVVRNSVDDIGGAIVHEAFQQRVDLIVMRSRRRPQAALLLGSTAATVCRNAPCPVLVTHPLEREWVGNGTGKIALKRVLIAHDFSDDSRIAMNFGVSLAQEYQAEVHLLHILRTEGNHEPELAWSSAVGGDAYTFTTKKLEQALPQEVCLSGRSVNVVRCGRIHEEILAYAREHEIDLICMGVSGSNWNSGKLLGSNVDRVLRQAPCPMLVSGAYDLAH